MHRPTSVERPINSLLCSVLLLLFSAQSIAKVQGSAPLILSLRPANVTVSARGDALFECHVQPGSGGGVTRITWRKNSKVLAENHKRYVVNHAGPEASYLRVTDAPQLGGSNQNHQHQRLSFLNLTCVAENAHGRVESTAHMFIVGEKDKPTRFPRVQVSAARSVEPDTAFQVECNAT